MRLFVQSLSEQTRKFFRQMVVYLVPSEKSRTDDQMLDDLMAAIETAAPDFCERYALLEKTLELARNFKPGHDVADETQRRA